ncbi:MAG: hypothetical protein ACK5M8_20340 [Shewanella algae]
MARGHSQILSNAADIVDLQHSEKLARNERRELDLKIHSPMLPKKVDLHTVEIANLQAATQLAREERKEFREALQQSRILETQIVSNIEHIKETVDKIDKNMKKQ